MSEGASRSAWARARARPGTLPLRSSLALSLVVALGGLAPATPLRVTVSDTVGRDWAVEPITWELTLEPGAWTGDKLGVKRDGKVVPAQGRVLERHPDGSVKAAEILLVIDRLPAGSSTALEADFSSHGPRDTDLRVTRGKGFLVLENRHTAVKVLDRQGPILDGEEISPLLGVRTASGGWTGGGRYETRELRAASAYSEILESGPVRLRARVTTTFDGGRRHAVTVSLLSGSRSIDIEESFDLGPEGMYRLKEYRSDRDELAWEHWSWYGDLSGEREDHPSNWFLTLSSADFEPRHVRYRGETSTDSDKGDTESRGESSYTLDFSNQRRLEKYLAAHGQWRPDAVTWYALSPGSDAAADALALFTHSARDWRNPNVFASGHGDLRTGANDLRILSFRDGRRLEVQCPIGLGARRWSIRSSSVEETFRATDASPTAISAEVVQRNLGLEITRRWITDWERRAEYPRLFSRPQEREAYYARLRGREVGASGALREFLLVQDRDSAEKLYRETAIDADRMIEGYFSVGLDLSNSYPGWMLGYWHGIAVATAMDQLLGSPFATEEMALTLRRKMAILTYCLVSRDAWPDKRINYGWGSMNMPVGRMGGLAIMVSSIADHPLAREWLKDAPRYYRLLLETEYNADGVHISCPHYIGASATSFYAWLALANSGLGEDVSASPAIEKFARYYMQLMTPVDPRWGIRTLLTEGDSRPGSSSFPGILATLLKRRDPDLAGQLIQLWREGGSELTAGMGVPDGLLIDPEIPPAKPRLGPQVFRGFGAVLRYREPGTPEEAYLSFLAGGFMYDHTNHDHLAFEWFEKGVPLTVYTGDMYVPGATTALSHNTLCWDVRPEGEPTPGKGKPGDWYHDHGLAWVEHVRRPRLHLQTSGDRGDMSLAADLPGAALLEGKLRVGALGELPTRADFTPALPLHARPPQVSVKTPFTWTRRLLYVKDAAATGANYLVVRDDLEGFAERTPNFLYWSLSEDAELETAAARFEGHLGVDTDLHLVWPPEAGLSKDSFTHTECEPIVARLHPERHGRNFEEKQVLVRAEGRAGEGFLVVIFPRRRGEERPAVEPWLGGKGIEVTWRGEKHRVLLDVVDRDIDAGALRARASCLVLKARSPESFSLSLPAGGEAGFAGETLRAEGPAELILDAGKTRRVTGRNLGARLLPSP